VLGKQTTDKHASVDHESSALVSKHHNLPEKLGKSHNMCDRCGKLAHRIKKCCALHGHHLRSVVVAQTTPI